LAPEPEKEARELIDKLLTQAGWEARNVNSNEAVSYGATS